MTEHSDTLHTGEGRPGSASPARQRPIFREPAKRRQQSLPAAIKWPRLLTPRVNKALWLLALLLLAVGLLVTFWPLWAGGGP